MTRDERIQVWKDTVKAVKEGRYEAENSEVVELTGAKEMMEQTVFYTDKCKCTSKNVCDGMNISVINSDCLYAAQKLVESGLKTCVLNMASFIRPGGGVTGGSSAQEESIFRRTNIYQSLFRYSSELAELYGLDSDEKQYPLELNYGAIYTPDVTVFRTAEGDGCKFMASPFNVNVVSIAAVKRPSITPDGDISDWAKRVLSKKVCQMLDVAMAHDNIALVLSAFGCGAYGTPPEPMAKIFKAVLSSDRFSHAFKEVVFAIIDDSNANRAGNTSGNFKPFKDVFGN